MPSQAEFDEKCDVTFPPLSWPQVNIRRYQAAMFKDNPDVWPMTRKPVHKPVKPLDGQIVLLDERPPCQDDECKNKRERRRR